MKTKAVRLYGKDDLRLEEFELPELQDDEILAHVVSDSICMSSYKAAEQGRDHKRVPNDIARHPIIIGHEFCGEIVEVGKKWQQTFQAGQKFSIQPALNYRGSLDAPGYSFEYIGGDATYIIIPDEVMEMECLLHYDGDAFFPGSLSEPMSCIVGAFHASYHTTPGTYVHEMGIVEGGNMALLAGCGPMGLGAIDYALHGGRKPKLLVMTCRNEARLKQAEKIFTPQYAAGLGVDLRYLNTNTITTLEQYLLELTGGQGYDDVFVFVPVKSVVEQGDRILAKDGCLNFFAGPTNSDFSARFNFYNAHYAATHIVGTSGGNTNDMIESLRMMEKNLINPATMLTHIGGLNAVVDTTLRLPKIPGGKKLIYTNIDMELTAIADLRDKGNSDPVCAALADIMKHNHGLWSAEAEAYLLANAKAI